MEQYVSPYAEALKCRKSWRLKRIARRMEKHYGVKSYIGYGMEYKLKTMRVFFKGNYAEQARDEFNKIVKLWSLEAYD